MATNSLDSPASERETDAAKDRRDRFDRAVAPLRRELHAHCYRMLGSVYDADDALQEALLRAWTAFDRFEGLVAALQRLSGNERAALLLVDVLGFTASDAAATMGTNATSMHSALARARRSVRKPAGSDRPAPAQPSDLALARRFADALAASDLEGFVALLAPDVTWQMPPMTQWYAGSEAVAAFAQAVPMTLCPSWRTRVITASGQAAVAFYVGERNDAPHQGWSVTLLDVENDAITGITSFLDAALFARLALPPSID
ncbi:nuclear transport factor 2 family protein [Microbacterium marinum]|uniref:nuclear transport factor 2 family protein n=1 Tax=Microbacterium marinum TaxID=421115 RepID=UPI00384F51FA